MEGVSCSGLVAEGVQKFVDVVHVWLCRQRVTGFFIDVIVVVTHPLLAAAARWDLQTGVSAVPGGQGYAVRAERHTAHYTVHAAALVLTAGLEILTVLVHVTAKLTRPTLNFS